MEGFISVETVKQLYSLCWFASVLASLSSLMRLCDLVTYSILFLDTDHSGKGTTVTRNHHKNFELRMPKGKANPTSEEEVEDEKEDEERQSHELEKQCRGG